MIPSSLPWPVENIVLTIWILEPSAISPASWIWASVTDAYGAIKVAVALSEAFGCDVNELPLSMVLSWYEQKAVCILLTLLHLGIKNIRLGPSLPAFLSPNVLNYLVENFGIAPITTPEEYLKELLK